MMQLCVRSFDVTACSALYKGLGVSLLGITATVLHTPTVKRIVFRIGTCRDSVSPLRVAESEPT
jgi:hypothetical protein